MTVKLRLFARARDLAGSEYVEVTLPARGTVADLRTELTRQFPALASLAAHLFIAVNEDYALDEMRIPEQGEIACFPPVSGG